MIIDSCAGDFRIPIIPFMGEESSPRARAFSGDPSRVAGYLSGFGRDVWGRSAGKYLRERFWDRIRSESPGTPLFLLSLMLDYDSVRLSMDREESSRIHSPAFFPAERILSFEIGGPGRWRISSLELLPAFRRER